MKVVPGKTYPDLPYMGIYIDLNDVNGNPVRVMLHDISQALHDSPYVVGYTIFVDDDIKHALKETEYPLDKAVENGLYDELCHTVESVVEDSSNVFEQIEGMIYAQELDEENESEELDERKISRGNS